MPWRHWCSTTAKPDGIPRNLLDVIRLHQAGWRHSIKLEQGIRTNTKTIAEPTLMNIEVARPSGFRFGDIRLRGKQQRR